VRGWIEAALQHHKLDPIDEVVQLRTWASSCVLRVHSAGGVAYFKAVAASNPQECPVTAYLAQAFPGAVPRVMAVEPGRRWLLMAECAGRNLEEITDVAVWERAARSYARLQVACAPRTRDLAERGCETRTLDALAQAIEPLVADAAALRSGGPTDLTAAELDALRAEVPALRRRCTALAGAGVPVTLEHGDLWPGNFLVDGERCAVLDWEDVSIAHPFLSLAPLAVGLGIYQGEQASAESVARLERAYLEPFAALLPMARLEDALRLARPLSFLDMAARYRQHRPSVTRLHPWMRDLVPEALRLALAELVR
jgi:aminoglycoside phosphotransferase (APT) family kinase protein